MGVSGCEKDRRLKLSATLLFWEALGFRLSWAKGARGDTVCWIGAELKFIARDGLQVVISVTIANEKADKLQSEVHDMLAPRFLNRQRLRAFATRHLVRTPPLCG